MLRQHRTSNDVDRQWHWKYVGSRYSIRDSYLQEQVQPAKPMHQNKSILLGQNMGNWVWVGKRGPVFHSCPIRFWERRERRRRGGWQTSLEEFDASWIGFSLGPPPMNRAWRHGKEKGASYSFSVTSFSSLPRGRAHSPIKTCKKIPNYCTHGHICSSGRDGLTGCLIHRSKSGPRITEMCQISFWAVLSRRHYTDVTFVFE